MKKLILFYLLSLPLCVSSQEITVTFPDNFDLQENPEYDNWTYQQNTFFALPLSISFFNDDFVSINQYTFNILYNPEFIQLQTEIIEEINNQDFTDSYNVLSPLSSEQANFGADIYEISPNQALATIYFSTLNGPLTQDKFDNGYGILAYLPFKKINACNKAPLSVTFSDGFIDGQYVNPDQQSVFNINNSLSHESGNVTIQNAFINFNILWADVIQNGNTLQPIINGGTPPYNYEWTDKMDVILSTDSLFNPEISGDYLFYVYDQNNCVYILYISYEQLVNIKELSKFSIYPNPATNHIKVKTNRFYAYDLINLNGRILSSGMFSSDVIINRNKLASGIYFLRLKNETEQIIKKVNFH